MDITIAVTLDNTVNMYRYTDFGKVILIWVYYSVWIKGGKC